MRTSLHLNGGNIHSYSIPDEWATTKQACRDEIVVQFAVFCNYFIYLLFSLQNMVRILLYPSSVAMILNCYIEKTNKG